MLLNFGLGVVMEDALKIVFGANPLRLEAPIQGATEMLGLFFPHYRLFVMLFGGAVIAAVWLLVFRTPLGAMVRAAAFDRHMTASLGVPVHKVYAATFAFGVALAALAGVLLAPMYSVFPTMGRDFVFIAFVDPTHDQDDRLFKAIQGIKDGVYIGGFRIIDELNSLPVTARF